MVLAQLLCNSARSHTVSHSMQEMKDPLLGDSPGDEEPAPGSGGADGAPPKQYSFLVAVSYTINCIVGVGLLAIPHAFKVGGLVFGCVVMAVSCAFITLGCVYVVETIARALGWAGAVFAEEIQRLHITGSPLPMYDSKKRPHLIHTRAHKPSSRAPATLMDLDEDSTSASDSEAERVNRQLLPSHETHVKKLRDVLARGRDEVIAHVRATEGAEGLYKPVTDVSAQDAEKDSFLQDRVDMDMSSVKGVQAFKDIGGRFFEMNELLDVFCPLWVKVLYELFTFAMLLMALWSFTSVFGTSMTGKIPVFDWHAGCDDSDYTSECEWTFRMFVIAYGVVVTWLTCIEMHEMVTFQIFLTIARFLLVLLIVVASLVGIFVDKADNKSTDKSAPYVGDYSLWDFGGLVAVLSATVFSQLVDFALPSILTPLRNKARASLVPVVAVFGTTALYVIVGISASLYFGDELKGQVNLNFQHFHGANHGTVWWAYVVQWFVSLFPALDVLSMFPLVAISLGNTIRALLVRSSRSLRIWDKHSAVVKIVSRVLAAVPPICCALAERNLTQIIKYASIPALWIAFVAPTMMQFFSRRKTEMLGVNPTTPYSLPVLSGPIGMAVVAVFSVVCYVLMIGQLIDPSFAS